MTYQPLETEFTKFGERLKEVHRDPTHPEWRIYERKKKREGHDGYLLQWEVIRVTTAEATTFQGKDYPPSEVYPTNSQWGSLAWTCVGGLPVAMVRLEKAKAAREPQPAFRVRVRKEEA